jgi:hypothetical protein
MMSPALFKDMAQDRQCSGLRLASALVPNASVNTALLFHHIFSSSSLCKFHEAKIVRRCSASLMLCLCFQKARLVIVIGELQRAKISKHITFFSYPKTFPSVMI